MKHEDEGNVEQTSMGRTHTVLREILTGQG